MEKSRWSLAPLELTLDSALDDSPHYRASLQRNEDQLDKLASIMESLVKGSRNCLELGARLTEAIGKLSPSIKRLLESEVFAEEKTPCCLSSMIDFVEAVFVLHERLMRDLGQRLLIPFVQSVQEDLKDIRDRRKGYEKARDRYESVISRFGSLPKLKEFSLVREDMFQLYDGRKGYYGVSFDYLGRINKFKLGVDLFFVERCLGTVRQLDQFMGAMGSMVKAMQQPAVEMQRNLVDWQKEAKQIAATLERRERETLEKVKALHSPDAPKAPSKGTEKSGYLFKKRQKGLGPSWRRVYVSMRDGLFRQYSPIGTSGSSRRGQVECSLDLHVLLCEIRVAEGAGAGGSGGGAGGAGGVSSDRRHCFEVVTSTKAHFYQAESDEEMREWIRVFESAKRFALRSSSDQISPDAAGGSVDDTSDLPTIDSFEVGLEESIDDATASFASSTQTTSKSRGGNPHQPLPPLPRGEAAIVSVSCLFEMDFPSSVHFGRLFGSMEGLYFQTNMLGEHQTWAFLWKAVENCHFTVQEITTTLTVIINVKPPSAATKGASPTTPSADRDDQTSTSPSNPVERESLTIRVTLFNDDASTCESLGILWRNARLEAPKTIHQLQLALRASNARGTPGKDHDELGWEGERGMAVGAVKCGCKDHLEKKEIDMILPIGVDELFKLLMGPESPVLKLVQRELSYKDASISPWKAAREGERTDLMPAERRDLRLIVPVNHPLVRVTETECNEEHFLLIKDIGRCYAVRQEACTPGVTYGDTFVALSHFCLTHRDSNKSRLKIFVGLRWVKSPLVKSMIKSGTLKGLSEYMAVYKKVVLEEVHKIKPVDSLTTDHLDQEELLNETDSLLGDKSSGAKSQNAILVLITEMFSLAGEFLNDIRMRWRHNIENFDVSRNNVLVLLASLAILTISIVLQVRHRGRGSSATDRNVHQYRSPFTLPHTCTGNQLDFATSNLKYQRLRKHMKRTMRLLDLSQCLDEEKIYISWLAEQLRLCYSHTAQHINHKQCLILEMEWTNVIRGSSKCELFWRWDGHGTFDDCVRKASPTDLIIDLLGD